MNVFAENLNVRVTQRIVDEDTDCPDNVIDQNSRGALKISPAKALKNRSASKTTTELRNREPPRKFVSNDTELTNASTWTSATMLIYGTPRLIPSRASDYQTNLLRIL